MTFLICHLVGLERSKRSYRVFGDALGELCFNYVTFSFEATRLYQAFRRIGSRIWKESDAINQIFGTAGKFTIMLERLNAMFPTIINSIGRRNLENSWDRLAIVSNCC